MIQVRRLGHVIFETPDVERQAAYYAEVMGLQLQRDGKRAILSSAVGEEAIVFKPGSAARLTTIALQVAPETEFSRIDAALREHGAKVERRSDISPALAYGGSPGTDCARPGAGRTGASVIILRRTAPPLRPPQRRSVAGTRALPPPR